MELYEITFHQDRWSFKQHTFNFSLFTLQDLWPNKFSEKFSLAQIFLPQEKQLVSKSLQTKSPKSWFNDDTD